MRRRWVVNVSSEHDDPFVYGPYSEKVARELAAKVNASIEARPDEDAEGSWMHATCCPIPDPGITEIRERLGLPRPPR